MKIKTKKVNVHKLTVSESELDWIQLAVALMLQNPNTHSNWHQALQPLLEQMRGALENGDEYE